MEVNPPAITLQEVCSIAAEVIRELLEGKSAAEILSNIDVNEGHLSDVAAVMEKVAESGGTRLNITMLSSEDNQDAIYDCTIYNQDGDYETAKLKITI